MTVSGPRTEFAPQIVLIAVDAKTIPVPADELGLLIDALTTIRDHMKEGTR